MAVPVAALAKLAAAALSDEDNRKRLGWIVAAICSPLILTLALICSLLSGSAEHNNSAVLLCFHGGTIPAHRIRLIPPTQMKTVLKIPAAVRTTERTTTADPKRIPQTPQIRLTLKTRELKRNRMRRCPPVRVSAVRWWT